MNFLLSENSFRYDWSPKPFSTALYGTTWNQSAQYCLVLQHPLIRGVKAEMIQWWYSSYANLNVQICDFEDNDRPLIPAIFLWHNFDQITLTDEKEEALKSYQKKKSKSEKINLINLNKSGWATKHKIPEQNMVVSHRVRFGDVLLENEQNAVAYHSEIVIDFTCRSFFSKAKQKKEPKEEDLAFWEIYSRYNVFRIGYFEHFLPSLFNQRMDSSSMLFSESMNSTGNDIVQSQGFNQLLFEERLDGYKESKDAFSFQDLLETRII